MREEGGASTQVPMTVKEAIDQLMHSRCRYELEHRPAQLVAWGQDGLDDVAMTHWRSDKRVQDDGLDDISTASTERSAAR